MQGSDEWMTVRNAAKVYRVQMPVTRTLMTSMLPAMSRPAGLSAIAGTAMLLSRHRRLPMDNRGT